jgi:methylmalonyl-CoA mutase
LEGLVSRADDGIEIAPLYAPALGNAVADRTPGSGWPAAWEIAQLHSHPDPAEAGRRAREDLEGGATSVLFRFDRAVARGDDRPDGVLVHDRVAFERLLAALPEERIPVRCEAGEWTFERLADLEILSVRRGAPQTCCWRILADPIGDALAGATGDPHERVEAVVAALAERPLLYLMADGRPWHEAGASEAQEIAAVLASAVIWLRAAEAGGVPLETALTRMELVLAVDTDLFLSLAKLRAARLCFERILEAADLGRWSKEIRIRAETGTRMLSRLDPWVNILRTTVAALAAITGGADVLTVQPFDLPLGDASPLARRIARNIQLILREEAGISHVRDPAGGSWYVAHLTRALAEAAWTRLQAIEAQGGLLATLETGALQGEVEALARSRLERLADRRDRLVGVSAFPMLQEKAPPSTAFDLGPALDAARTALAGHCTRLSFHPFPPLRRIRLAEPFEQLRDRATAARQRDGVPPRVLVVGLGRTSELHDLVTEVENLLAAGGLVAVRSPNGEPSAAVEALLRLGGRSAILCVGASAAPRAAELAAALRAAGARRIWLAGAAEPWPTDVAVIGRGMNVVAFLEELHSLLDAPKWASGASP